MSIRQWKRVAQVIVGKGGNGNATLPGMPIAQTDVIGGGKSFKDHTHTGVQPDTDRIHVAATAEKEVTACIQ